MGGTQHETEGLCAHCEPSTILGSRECGHDQGLLSDSEPSRGKETSRGGRFQATARSLTVRTPWRLGEGGAAAVGVESHGLSKEGTFGLRPEEGPVLQLPRGGPWEQGAARAESLQLNRAFEERKELVV